MNPMGLLSVVVGFGALLLIVLSIGGNANQPRATAVPYQNWQVEAPGDQWVGTAWQSPMTDFQNYALHVRAAQPLRDKYGRRVAPSLHIVCREDVTSIWVDADEYIGIDEIYVETRIDDDEVQADTWIISTANDSLGFWRGSTSIPFLRQLIERSATRLTLRYTPYGENARTVSFDVSSLDVRIEGIRTACGW